MHWIAFVALAMSACTTFHGVKPLAPEQGNPNYPPRIDNVQPTLRWTPAETPGTTYDLVILEGVGQARDFWHGEERKPGPQVYYREGLAAPEHRLEQPLEKDKLYFWSVRTRNGDQVSAWSKYDWRLFLVLGWNFIYNAPFRFYTPANDAEAGK